MGKEGEGANDNDTKEKWLSLCVTHRKDLLLKLTHIRMRVTEMEFCSQFDLPCQEKKKKARTEIARP